MINDLEKIANNYFEEKKYFQAEPLFMKIIAKNPQNADALYKLGYINLAKLDYKTSSMLLHSSFKITGSVKTLELLAYTKEKEHEIFDAIIMYEKVLEIKPNSALYEKICDLYIELELYDNAIEITKQYTEKYPTVISYRRLFLLYLSLSQIDNAKKICNEMQEKFENQGIAINMLGMYKEYIDYNLSEAAELYEKAARLGSPTAGYDLAKCYKKLGQYELSEKWAKKSINVYPKKEHILSLLSEIYFEQKKMRKGYKYYLDRPLSKEIKKLKNKWNGKPVSDSVLLVYPDTDDINTIRNLRYVLELKKVTKNVMLLTSDKFEPLFKYNNIKTVNFSDIKNVKYDKYVLLSELPYYLNLSFENIPKQVLKSEKKELDNKYKIGLVWKNTGNNNESISIQALDISECLKELLEIDDISFYSFQKDDIFNVLQQYPQIIDLSDKLNNYKDYADYIASMDIVIGIDSPTLHLAGSLGIPAFAILSDDAAWYWFNNNSKTEWYKSVKIFRKISFDVWNDIKKSLVEKVKDDKHKTVK